MSWLSFGWPYHFVMMYFYKTSYFFLSRNIIWIIISKFCMNISKVGTYQSNIAAWTSSSTTISDRVVFEFSHKFQRSMRTNKLLTFACCQGGWNAKLDAQSCISVNQNETDWTKSFGRFALFTWTCEMQMLQCTKVATACQVQSQVTIVLLQILQWI